jgi:hypothetical protein
MRYFCKIIQCHPPGSPSSLLNFQCVTKSLQFAGTPLEFGCLLFGQAGCSAKVTLLVPRGLGFDAASASYCRVIFASYIPSPDPTLCGELSVLGLFFHYCLVKQPIPFLENPSDGNNFISTYDLGQ